jgi:pseudaminic acid synthase
MGANLMAPIDFIAEVSANHLGSRNRAKEIVIAAAKSGATSVKFQTYTADTMTLDLEEFSVSPDHQLWGGRRLYALYEEAYTPWEWHEELFEVATSLGLVPFSTPFDLTALEFLEKIGSTKYKIASLETGDLQLIEAVAATGKPIIVSTGASEWDEIHDAVSAVRKTGNKHLTLLVCTSSYPTDPGESHIKRILALKREFKCEVGLSDHTLGIGASIAAIALGATTIEKHLTLRRTDGGADSAFSMEPEEFSALVKEGKIASQSLGNENWAIQPSEKESRRLRRTLYIVKDVDPGEVVSQENIRAIRPGAGLAPKFLTEVLGRKFAKSYVRGTPLNLEMIVDP